MTVDPAPDLVRDALRRGLIGERLWMYSNYDCNLACTYCLTESAPRVRARALGAERMVQLTHEAVQLGFGAIGITGGEPFLVPELPEVLAEIAEVLPVVVLSNATMFTRARLERMRPLGGLDVRVQISLDRSEAVANDQMRGPENFAKVVKAIPALLGLGIGVRIASTLAWVDDVDMAKLCALHRSLGVGDDDHIVRGIVRRGRALTEDLGTDAGIDELAPELTITADGAFWSPFGPTVVGGRLDTDLMISRGTRPLRRPAEAMVGLIDGTGYAGPVDDRFT